MDRFFDKIAPQAVELRLTDKNYMERKGGHRYLSATLESETRL